MTVSEYEERFQISSPSLHETFVAMQGSGPRRRRRQRFWAAIALVGGIMAANEVAPHRPAHDVTHSASQMAAIAQPSSAALSRASNQSKFFNSAPMIR
jgi:anaerobic C4-dicarboxylate transporter